jgi:hypothetical protein
MTVSLNTVSPPFVKKNGKSSAAVDAANILDLLIARNPDANVDALIRALEKVLGVGRQYIKVARRLSAEQRDAVQRGERPLILSSLIAARLARAVA